MSGSIAAHSMSCSIAARRSARRRTPRGRRRAPRAARAPSASSGFNSACPSAGGRTASLADRPVEDDRAAVEHDDPLARALDQRRVVRDEHERRARRDRARRSACSHLRWKASSPTASTSSMSSTSASRCAAIAKPSRRNMPARVRRDRRVDEVARARRTRRSRPSAPRSARLREPVQRAVEEDVLAAGEVAPEAGAELELRDDLPAARDAPGVQRHDPGQHAQRRGLARAVAPDDADGLARLDAQRDVAQRLHRRRAAAARAPDEHLLQRAAAVGLHA